jgi:glycosyltransferase involved in cell wall biosynthesis
LINYIQNGTPIPEKNNRKEKPKYAFCLGRVCPEKGFHLAIEAARKAKIPLIFAGEVFSYPEHIAYFETKIKPNLDSLNYRFIGKIGNLQKEYLYNNSLCVLIPSLIDETSSLVAMEALAHGTPVIAFKRGALSEIIINGVNGFLVQNVNEMTDAIRNVGKLSSEDCYKIAKEKYDQRIMVKKYLNSYFKLISDSSQNELTNK